MKYIIILVIVLGAILGGIALRPNVQEYVAPVTEVGGEVVVEETEEPEPDTITRAQLELERINAELDATEQELLDQKSAIESELERLRKTRTSFQSAPAPKDSPAQ